jgi:FkbM family methyltransferase
VGWRHLVKMGLAEAGIDIRRQAENPAHNLLGLRRLGVRTVLDVGANEGQFAREALKRFPEAHVYSFEPLPGAFAKLNSWAAGQDRVTPVNIALGDRDEALEIHMHSEHSPSSSLLRTTDLSTALYPFTAAQESVSVPVRRLDDWAASKSLQAPTLIKLDVQGYEIFGSFDQLAFKYAGNLNQVYAADGHVIYLDALFVR